MAAASCTIGMLHKNILNFYGAYPHALDLHHVVIAAHVPVVALSIAIVFVAGADPVALNGLFRLLMLVPVIRADGIAS